MYNVTGKAIRKELQGHYGSFIVIFVVFAAIAGFCVWFCGTQLGWTHLFTIIGMVCCGIALLGFLWVIVRLLSVRGNRLFRKYGSAETIAETINQGLRNPRYLDTRFDGTPALLISERCIVSCGNYMGYLELADIRRIKPQALPDARQNVYVGNPAMSVGRAAANYANQRYLESRGVNESNRCDILHIIDNDGVSHDYSVQRSHMNTVLQLLQELAPQAQIVM